MQTVHTLLTRKRSPAVAMMKPTVLVVTDLEGYSNPVICRQFKS